MKTREKNQRKNNKKTYEAPYIEVYEVEIESGFAQSEEEQNESYYWGNEQSW